MTTPAATGISIAGVIIGCLIIILAGCAYLYARDKG